MLHHSRIVLQRMKRQDPNSGISVCPYTKNISQLPAKLPEKTHGTLPSQNASDLASLQAHRCGPCSCLYNSDLHLILDVQWALGDQQVSLMAQMHGCAPGKARG